MAPLRAARRKGAPTVMRPSVAAGADEGDRAKFAKLRDYLLRLDDEVTCKTCG